jgi:prepilin-type N-terminal cleavage/methylation domain-containing protein
VAKPRGGTYTMKNQGFSLMEFLLVVFILALVSTVIASFSNDLFSLSRVIGKDLSSQQEVRIALKRISSELRSTLHFIAISTTTGKRSGLDIFFRIQF